ncbi:MAG: calcium/sodium antiporter [Clostridia bacterium]|nr:calcium/sodium antiporter [Clostridia bacterium]MBQ3042636.1 calcium/sodium antiporter [Clostridia bacterium]MBQ4272142.1 calcium/sodium antiporter [Clostridia bacterium]MBR2985995.1 calcium/sodium antiporter [Clostridia bacterium]
MLVPILLFLLGLVLLIKGGDWFVDGATVIARKFHLPDILIGATVVSIGTTLPEVMVSATSAVGGHGEIAYGNAIGSIICNTALIAAITITFKPAKVDRDTMKLPVIFFFIASVLYCLVAYLLGYFYWWVGAILLAIFVVYMFLSVRKALKTPQIREDDPAEGVSNKQFIKSIILLVVGAALIAIGADLLVDNGIIIAEALGVPEAVIALTFIAIGTSLPELVTAITSLVKGHGSLSLGNIIGANIFNLVLVSGLSTVLSPFPVPNNNQIWGINSSLVIDLPIMMLVMVLLTIPSLIRGKLSRWQGIVLLTVYAGFCALQFTI